MGDDIGWENLGSYHQGLMLDATPNLDKLAAEGMRFTDYYAEASCTAGQTTGLPAAQLRIGTCSSELSPLRGEPSGRLGRAVRDTTSRPLRPALKETPIAS
jgi:arylsulfatase A-like enzyme